MCQQPCMSTGLDCSCSLMFCLNPELECASLYIWLVGGILQIASFPVGAGGVQPRQQPSLLDVHAQPAAPWYTHTVQVWSSCTETCEAGASKKHCNVPCERPCAIGCVQKKRPKCSSGQVNAQHMLLILAVLQA